MNTHIIFNKAIIKNFEYKPGSTFFLDIKKDEINKRFTKHIGSIYKYYDEETERILSTLESNFSKYVLNKINSFEDFTFETSILSNFALALLIRDPKSYNKFFTSKFNDSHSIFIKNILDTNEFSLRSSNLNQSLNIHLLLNETLTPFVCSLDGLFEVDILKSSFYGFPLTPSLVFVFQNYKYGKMNLVKDKFLKIDLNSVKNINSAQFAKSSDGFFKAIISAQEKVLFQLLNK